MTKKLIATTAAASLALTGIAVADKPDKPVKPENRGAKGKSFTLKGVSATGLTVTDGKLAGPVTLDPTSANKRARTFLALSKGDLKGTKTVTFGTAADAVRITYVGLTAGTAPAATDTVKVIGRVKGGTLDIRKIVVKRPEAQTQS